MDQNREMAAMLVDQTNRQGIKFIFMQVIDHFRVPLSLTFSASVVSVFIHFGIRTNYDKKNFAPRVALRTVPTN